MKTGVIVPASTEMFDNPILNLDALCRQVFIPFFLEANRIRCTEKTFHALFCHHLATAGVPLRSVAREARHDGSPVDVLMYGKSARGAFSEHPDKVITAFEFKGGAYGNRNALTDTINSDGFCADMDKLAAFKVRQVPAWFICIDQADLGVALGQDLRRRTARQCVERGLGFAYFCQGENSILLAPPGGSITEQELTSLASGSGLGRPLDLSAVVTGPFVGMADEAMGSEDDYVFRLYHALRLAGCTSQQLALETYFSFAKRGCSRMQLRPDLCVFDTSVNGHFNLYRGGQYHASNDSLKLQSLRALVEVKGSVGTSKISELQFSRLLRADLEKLANWKVMLNAAFADLGVTREVAPTLMLVALDIRTTPLSAAMLADLHGLAAHNDVAFAHRHISKSSHAGSLRKKSTGTASQLRRLGRASDTATDQFST